MILFVGGTVTLVQQPKKTILPDSLKSADSLFVFRKGFSRDQLDNMPIYNPKDVDARIMVLKSPAKPVDNMPIWPGKRDSSKTVTPISDLGKHPLKQWPSNIYGKQKDKPTKHK